MPRGKNPKSWNNKPTIPGLKSAQISLYSEQWVFLEIIGRNNKSKGGRETIKAMQIIAERNWAKAAVVLDCCQSPDAIAQALLCNYPDLKRGQKTEADLIQELALGECSLAWRENEIIRVVNLASIAIIDSDCKLVEAYQQLANGDMFSRNIEGVAEKIQYPESPEEGALRGLKEELGVVPAALKYLGQSFEKNQRSKYQGIESYARKHQFRATLKPEDIKKEYVEERDGIKTVFKWVCDSFSG